MSTDNLEEILLENQQRNARLQQVYDPILGIGSCGSRVLCGDELLPSALISEHPEYDSLTDLERRRLRVQYDFEYWCATCATIIDKLSNAPVNFRLNGPQRKVLAIMESQREQGQPVRIILLKARQWGGSTLVQM